MTDAIGAAGAGLHRARAMLDAAAVRVARADLPTAPRSPKSPEIPPVGGVDGAGSASLGDSMALALIARENHAANRAVMEIATDAYRGVLSLADRA